MNDNVIRIFTEQYENGKTGETVDGVTIMIDGKLKQVLDRIIEKQGKNSTYPEIIRDILFAGIADWIQK